MYIKKEFALYEYLEEEAYLSEMAKKGYCLEKALGDGFEFKECSSQKNIYRVIYSLDEFLERDYPGFLHVDTFSSSKGGYYHYLLLEDGDGILPINKDRNYRLKNDQGRIERFSGIVIGSLLILFLYLFYTYKNPLYLTIVGSAIILGAYVWNLRSKIIQAIQE